MNLLLNVLKEDSDDDIVMPEGPRPGDAEQEANSDDEDIPLPEGLPPGSIRTIICI